MSENYRIKETTSTQTDRRGGDVERVGPHPCVVDKNLGGISQEPVDPAPHQAPQPMIPVPGKYVPIPSGCKNQLGLSW